MRTFAAYLAVSFLALPLAAVALEPSLTEHPDPSSAQYYIANEANIEALRKDLRRGESSQARLAALQELEDMYPAAAFSSAIDLIADPDEAIALAAIDLISRVIVMSDHRMVEELFDDRLKYTMEQHMRGRNALRPAVEDERERVRMKAALVLAGLSDEAALDRINAGIASGLYSETVAINLFALAKSEVGSAYIEPYLDKGTESAQIAAVAYLGSDPAYQKDVRTRVFQNPERIASVRAQSARTLSRYDSRFHEYALTVTIDPDANPELFAESLKGYIYNLQAQGKPIDPPTANVLTKGVAKYAAQKRNLLVGKPVVAEQLKAIQERLNLLAPQL